MEHVQDSPDPRAADLDIVITLEIDHDLPGANVVVLP